MGIKRFILLQIYVFGICGNSSYGKGWITDFLCLAIYIAVGIWDCKRKYKNKSNHLEKWKELDVSGGIMMVIYAHFFMGSNGVRNPYGLIDSIIPTILYWGTYFVIYLILEDIWNKKQGKDNVYF